LIAKLTVFFSRDAPHGVKQRTAEIGRSSSIVAETEQIPNRRNSSLNSRAQILTDRGDGSSLGVQKFALLNQRVIIDQNNRVGVRESTVE
jgi:hypothetical protein